eukprot:NODE_1263_length_2543_cov_10.730132.p1 GENE.NODE_1263_length_2543_cov_10.730132~~NODE_1263_length_2543_cov_10.730132.p1  ORF type:complete len:804 (+),score=140.01 NODE_1263_length_2543_cov_10.730132:275-2413(+)
MPNCSPLVLESFEGTFKSSLSETNSKVLAAGGTPEVEDKEAHLDRLMARDKIFMRYFEEAAPEEQYAGEPMRDLAHEFYSMKDNACNHMRKGLGKYVDNSTYDGEYLDGLPHGAGVLTQWKRYPEEWLWLAKYDGQWDKGKMHGNGEYTREGLIYNGEWADGKRHGKGKQTLTESSVAASEFRYLTYNGEWEQEQHHGQGVIQYTGDISYEGHFELGVRKGHGEFSVNKGTWICNARWDDRVDAMKVPCWLHVLDAESNVGDVYFGNVTEDLKRTGHGRLYSRRIVDLPVFKDAYKEYRHCELGGGDEYKYLMYDGEWANDAMHGMGTQYFENHGRYCGKMANGYRHGRGTWTSNQTGWTYRACEEGENGDVPNWEGDKNPVPLTRLDKLRGKKESKKESGPPKRVIPTMESTYSKVAEYLQPKRQALNQKNNPTAEVFAREPTELYDAHYDVLICGGTEDNEVLNGYYFKLSACDKTVFRHVPRPPKVVTGLVDERYIYSLGENTVWCIGTKSGLLRGFETNPGCAIVEDKKAGHPRNIKEPWFVWEPIRGHEAEAGLVLDEDAMTATDKIRVVTVSGFVITGLLHKKDDLLLLRQPREFNDRPVYEDEMGHLSLYFFNSDPKSVGARVGELEAASRPSANDLFAMKGYWVLATELGVGPDSNSCRAYVVDSAVTPAEIDPSEPWQIVVQPPAIPRVVPRRLAIRMEVWDQ